MRLKDNLIDYTEQEFLDFIAEIDRANDDESDAVLSSLLLHFAKITEHPSGFDLLYNPASKEEGEPREVLRIVKEWRMANGRSGFKAV